MKSLIRNRSRILILLNFIVLFSVLLYLSYNTFELKERKYVMVSNEMLKKWYDNSISEDKVYPGAQQIIDNHLIPHIVEVEKLILLKDTNAFDKLRTTLLSRLINELQRKNPMDSLFNNIKEKLDLDTGLQYCILIHNISYQVKDKKTIEIFNDKTNKLDFPKGLILNKSFYIGGNLLKPSSVNAVSSLSVSSTDIYSYRIRFSFYVGQNNRTREIITMISPILLLILSAIGLLFFTLRTIYSSLAKEKKLSDMKSDFLNSITHEFHTPITTILVANKSLQKDKVLDNREAVKNLTSIIFRQSKRLESLFKQVLDVTSLQEMDFTRDATSLREIIKDTIQDYKLQLQKEETRIDFTTTISKENDVILVNQFWFTTMMFNLLTNALKYNNKSKKTIKVTLRENRGNYILEIEDNGDGILKEVQEHIFDKFYRNYNQKSLEISGLGLGLYYVKQCVSLHGWKISVSSQINQGTKFTITI